MKDKRLLWIPLAAACLIHGTLAVQWISIWGFFGAIIHWFQTFNDPISAAAAFDLIVCMIVLWVWFYIREGRWTKALTISFLPFVVFPAIGTFLYLLLSEKRCPNVSSRD